MEFSDATKAVFQRINKMDPENVSRIVGYLLLEGYTEQQMIRLVYCPDNTISSLIEKFKQDLEAKLKMCDLPLTPKFTPFTPASSSTSLLPSPGNAPMNQQLVHSFQYVPMPIFDPSTGGHVFCNQPYFLPMEYPTTMGSPYFQPSPGPGYIAPQGMSPPETKFCENFSNGFCKYGGSCRFLHVSKMENGNFMVLNPPNEMGNNVFPSNGCLRKLEFELAELLRPLQGVPLPITSLTVMYFEKYRRVLQTEGFFGESRLQGKVGCNLPILLAQMSRSIRLIDRPHGEQCVILQEHMPLYMRFVEEAKVHEMNETGVNNPCQIFLTFPPDSSFNELHVYKYFNNFGLVQDVRLAPPEKRMYGFVTFTYADTARFVLAKGNPHFINGARVLAKPYKDKPFYANRKLESLQASMASSSSSFVPPPPEYKLLTRKPSNNNIWVPKQRLLIEELDPTVDGSNIPEGVVTNGCTSIVSIQPRMNNEESFDELNLPEDPFAFDHTNFGIWSVD